MKHFNGRVVVVTGASAGIGRATVREFARQGASIGLMARGLDGLRAAKMEVERLGGRALILQTDVADPEAVETAAERIEQEFGPIDIWVNNAMASVFSPVKEMKPEEYRRVMEVTYLGYVHGTLSALRRMLARDSGVIVQVGSALAYRSIPLQSAYCAAKHAILGFTESLRSELLHDHSRVRVTMVEAPAANTPQFGWVRSRLPNKAQPVPPIFQPELIARAILFAAAHPRREVKVGFSTVKAIFAEKFVPSLADWYLAKRGYSGQQTDMPRDPRQPENLYAPVPGDHGARGSFDSAAKRFSWQFWAAENRRTLLFTSIAFSALNLITNYLRSRTSEKRREEMLNQGLLRAA
ncbi:MAG TPA: SDR family oxidoreductase [Bdellovibrionota bacterium]|nr:SDR family oxidoreductase [Bdellovibrionota bacterium]